MSTLNNEIPHWTLKQREWFLRRDDHRCQFLDIIGGTPKQCGNKYNLHLHHIVPRRWAKHLKWTKEQANAPTNGIVLCSFCHLYKIHPDIGYLARKMYFYDETSYQKIEQWHDILTNEGIPYWWDIWDGILRRIATTRTRDYLKVNPDDPFPNE